MRVWGFDEVQQAAGQVDGVGGRAGLVPDDAQRVPLAAQLEHGFHEVVGVFGVEPARAQDEILVETGGNGLLALQLGKAINAARRRGVSFEQGLVAGAGKHEIGGDVQQRGAVGGAEAGQVFGPVAVHAAGSGYVVLGLVYGRVGGAIDDVGRPALGKNGSQRVHIQNVSLLLGQKNQAGEAPRARHVLQALP